MKLETSHIAFAVVCFVAGSLVGAGLRSCRKPKETIVPIEVHDTITITKDIVREKTTVRYKTISDTAVVFCHDTLRDTIWVSLPIEHKEYRDTFKTDSSRVELGVLFSGYKAEIDSIDLRYRLDVKPRTIVKEKGWGQFIGVGIGAGYGVSVMGGNVYAAPEVGVHVTYGWGYHW